MNRQIPLALGRGATSQIALSEFCICAKTVVAPSTIAAIPAIIGSQPDWSSCELSTAVSTALAASGPTTSRNCSSNCPSAARGPSTTPTTATATIITGAIENAVKNASAAA